MAIQKLTYNINSIFIRISLYDILLLQDSDIVVTGHYPGLKDLNINGMTVETVLPDYIFRFRDSGQFNRD